MNEELKYKTGDYIVAFIDILGSSADIKKDVDSSLDFVHKAYDDAVETYKSVFKKQLDFLKIRIFSDNIVISIPYTENGIKNSFYVLVVLCALIQENFLKYRILSRGGIAFGKFFADDIMLWGTALVDAYELESSVAIYPRIIVHPKLIAKVNHNSNPIQDSLQEKFDSWLYQDEDGLFYVDYFNDFRYLNNPLLLLLTYLKDNEERMIEYSENVKVLQKILWHGEYLARKLSELDQK